MSKKLTIKGKKLLSTSDKSLARNHKKGSAVQVIQPAKDNKWGRYYFLHYERHILILNEAIKYYEKTTKLLEQCRKLKIDKTNSRFLPVKLRNKLELASVKFLVMNKIGFEYLTQEMFYYINNVQLNKNQPSFDADKMELKERLGSLLILLGIKEEVPQNLIKLLDRRDIVEHPTKKRLYNALKTEWKNNHLAWVLSGELDGSFEEVIKFAEKLIKEFSLFLENNKTPGKLKVQRGLKSLDQFKKWKS